MKNFFTDQSIRRNEWFDDAPVSLLSKPADDGRFHNTGSIDTSGLDARRQGVEITSEKHFTTGLIKIHAGEPGHVLRRANYGNGVVFYRDYPFIEKDKFVAADYIEARSLGLALVYSSSFPTESGDDRVITHVTTDGAIEPLRIREELFYSLRDAPKNPHIPRGQLMEGTPDQFGDVRRLSHTYQFGANSHDAYVDQHINPLSASFQVHEISSARDEITHKQKISFVPYNDRRIVRNVVTSSLYDNDLIAGLSLMSGSSESYLSMNESTKTATMGWTYDNSYGTPDSIAFGGYVY